MNKTEKWLADSLKNYVFICRDIDRLMERLNSVEYRLTPSYSLEAGGSGGWNNSKVENMGIRRVELETDLDRLRSTIKKIDEAIEMAGLTKRERDMMKHIIGGGSLSSFARQKNIYKSHVYKIRDGAIKKMARYIKDKTNGKIG